MKKLILIFAISQALLFSLNAQTAPGDKENLKQANQQTVASYQAGKLDDALKFAQQAVDLSVKIFGAEHVETATAYANLGAIYQAKKKYKEAAASFEKTLSIYRQKPGANEKMTARALNDLAFVQALGGDRKQAEQTYLLALASAENAYGKDSREILPFLKSFAEFYVFDDKLEQAQPFYIRSYLLAAKHFPAEGEQLQEIENEYYCRVLSANMSNREEIIKRNAQFLEARSSGAKPDENRKIIRIGILNGSAKFLGKPEYPREAKEKRVSGKVLVRILIDENGNVTEAKAVCGDAALQRAGEAAAGKSRFEPFKIDGQTVKAAGFLVYNFVAR